MADPKQIEGESGAFDARKAEVVERELYATERREEIELNVNAQIAVAQADIQARFVIAKNNPRDWDNVRVQLLHHCKRKGFAETARYKITNRGAGWTIRFAEAVLREMGNIDTPKKITHDGAEFRKIEVAAIDLERNIRQSEEIIVPKTVERHDATGREIVTIRQNTAGQTVYVVKSTPDELLALENSMRSKARRNCILALVYADILDECMAAVAATKLKGVTDDPDKARKEISDAFAGLNITPADLKKVLGVELNQLQPPELVDLRDLFMAIRGGEITWREFSRTTGGDETAEEGTQAGIADRLKAKMSEKRPPHKNAQNKPEEPPVQAQKGENDKKPEPSKEAPKPETKPDPAKAEPKGQANLLDPKPGPEKPGQ